MRVMSFNPGSVVYREALARPASLEINIQGNRSVMPENPSVNIESSSVSPEAVRGSMAQLMRLGAGRPEAGESVKGQISRAARRFGISASLAKRLWYQEIVRIPADIADTLRLRAATLLAAERRRADMEIARLETLLQAAAPLPAARPVGDEGG